MVRKTRLQQMREKRQATRQESRAKHLVRETPRPRGRDRLTSPELVAAAPVASHGRGTPSKEPTADASAPSAASRANVSKPRDAPSAYVVMLKLRQGTLSPLDGVSLANCPKPLLRLALQCCSREATARPTLGAAALELMGPILTLLDDYVLEARRPSTPLCGWRATVQAVEPSLLSPEQCTDTLRSSSSAHESSNGFGAADLSTGASSEVIEAPLCLPPSLHKYARASSSKSGACMPRRMHPDMDGFDFGSCAAKDAPGRISRLLSAVERHHCERT